MPTKSSIALLSLCVLGELSLSLSARASEFRDTQYGYSITPPAFGAPPEGTAVIRLAIAGPAEDGFAPNMNVAVQQATLTREAFISLSEQQFAAAGIKVLSKQNRTVSGRPAVLFEYQGSVGGPELHFLALAVVLPERVLLVTCTALQSTYSSYEPEFRRSLQSFELASAP